MAAAVRLWQEALQQIELLGASRAAEPDQQGPQNCTLCVQPAADFFRLPKLNPTVWKKLVVDLQVRYSSPIPHCAPGVALRYGLRLLPVGLVTATTSAQPDDGHQLLGTGQRCCHSRQPQQHGAGAAHCAHDNDARMDMPAAET